MINSASGNIMELLYNFQLLALLGEVGVAAFGVSSYLTQVLISVFYAIGQTTVAVVGYKFGDREYAELQSFFRQSSLLSITIGILMSIVGNVFAPQIASIFVSYDPTTMELAVTAIRISSLSFLLQGFNIVTGSTFTGLSDATLSAVVSLCGSLVGPTMFIFLLPWLFGANGIWITQPAGALLTAAVSILLLLRYNKGKLQQLKSSQVRPETDQI